MQLGRARLPLPFIGQINLRLFSFYPADFEKAGPSSVSSACEVTIVLQFVNGGTYLAALQTQQLQALAQAFLNVRTSGYNITIVFVWLGSMVFLYLFLKSRYIPRALAGYGILSYSLMLASDLVTMLVPRSSEAMMMGGTVEIICYAPGILFEIGIGLWLLLRGVKAQPGELRGGLLRTPAGTNPALRGG